MRVHDNLAIKESPVLIGKLEVKNLEQLAISDLVRQATIFWVYVSDLRADTTTNKVRGETPNGQVKRSFFSKDLADRLVPLSERQKQRDKMEYRIFEWKRRSLYLNPSGTRLPNF